jgi:hypothetical protein
LSLCRTCRFSEPDFRGTESARMSKSEKALSQAN